MGINLLCCEINKEIAGERGDHKRYRNKGLGTVRKLLYSLREKYGMIRETKEEYLGSK